MKLDLFEDVIAENEKYINVLDALNLVSKRIKYSVPDVAKRLLIDKFQQVACMYRENKFNQIEIYCSEKGLDGNYIDTTNFLESAIATDGTFDFTETDDFGNEYKYTESDWFDRYWLKSDFFNFHTITKLNIKESHLDTYLHEASRQAFVEMLSTQENMRIRQEATNKAKVISNKFFDEQKQYESSIIPPLPIREESELQEIERLKADLAKAQERIKQLEAEKQENTISNELTGIEKLNQSAKDRQGMARIIATKLWKDDPSILIGAMADTVYREMINYCMDELPDNTDTLKNWIRPIAPSQAQRRGRPPKKSAT
ncbi:hypothetical protein [Acinetobacter towneri]|uniref:hypothetical protein n=1 Tax=Acinetobacter towneri TaxID=202956 RepID=UPI0034D7B321